PRRGWRQRYVRRRGLALARSTRALAAGGRRATAACPGNRLARDLPLRAEPEPRTLARSAPRCLDAARRRPMVDVLVATEGDRLTGGGAAGAEPSRSNGRRVRSRDGGVPGPAGLTHRRRVAVRRGLGISCAPLRLGLCRARADADHHPCDA